MCMQRKHLPDMSCHPNPSNISSIWYGGMRSTGFSMSFSTTGLRVVSCVYGSTAWKVWLRADSLEMVALPHWYQNQTLPWDSCFYLLFMYSECYCPFHSFLCTNWQSHGNTKFYILAETSNFYSTQHVCDVGSSQHVSCDTIAAAWAMNEQLNLSVCAIVAWLNSRGDLREHQLHKGHKGQLFKWFCWELLSGSWQIDTNRCFLDANEMKWRVCAELVNKFGTSSVYSAGSFQERVLFWSSPKFTLN